MPRDDRYLCPVCHMVAESYMIVDQKTLIMIHKMPGGTTKEHKIQLTEAIKKFLNPIKE